MKTIEKQIMATSESEMRELFADRISGGENILWHGGSFYCYGDENKSKFDMGMIITPLFIAALVILIVIQLIAGHFETVIALLLALVFMVGIFLVLLDSHIGLTYPRYSLITDKRLVQCKRGLRGRIVYTEYPYKSYRHISSKKIRKSDNFNVVVGVIDKHNEDAFFVISNVSEKEAEITSKLIEEQAELSKKYDTFNM